MCLSARVAFLGPADAVLDLTGRRLLFAPGLTSAERVTLARRVLAAAGQEQPPDEPGEVVCVCGFGLDVSPGKLRRHVKGPGAHASRPRSHRSTSLRR